MHFIIAQIAATDRPNPKRYFLQWELPVTYVFKKACKMPNAVYLLEFWPGTSRKHPWNALQVMPQSVFWTSHRQFSVNISLWQGVWHLVNTMKKTWILMYLLTLSFSKFLFYPAPYFQETVLSRIRYTITARLCLIFFKSGLKSK